MKGPTFRLHGACDSGDGSGAGGSGDPDAAGGGVGGGVGGGAGGTGGADAGGGGADAVRHGGGGADAVRHVEGGVGRRAVWEIGAAICLCAALLLSQVGGVSAWVSAYAAGEEGPAAGVQRVVRYAPYEAAREMQVAATEQHPGYAVYAWGDASTARRALVVLHGMGGNGPQMAASVLPFAQAQGWVVVAPTIPYGDWQDPNTVASEVVSLQPQLAEMIGSVAAETGERIADRVLMFGFSRGAQAALRFAMLYPERVQAVAASSAGTYTLPVETVMTSAGAPLDAPLPYGVSDLALRIGHGINTKGLARVRFLISVGEADNHEEDVPRQWDAYIGRNRVERAKQFGQMLLQQGYQAQVAVVPRAGHEMNGLVLERVLSFLAQTALQSEAV